MIGDNVNAGGLPIYFRLSQLASAYFHSRYFFFLLFNDRDAHSAMHGPTGQADKILEYRLAIARARINARNAEAFIYRLCVLCVRNVREYFSAIPSVDRIDV